MKKISLTITKKPLRWLLYSACATIYILAMLLISWSAKNVVVPRNNEGHKTSDDIGAISGVLDEIVIDANGVQRIADLQSSKWPEEFAGRLRGYDLRLKNIQETLSRRRIFSDERQNAVTNLLMVTQDMDRTLVPWASAAEIHDVERYNIAANQFNAELISYNYAVKEHNKTGLTEANAYLVYSLTTPRIIATFITILLITIVHVVSMIKIFRKAGYAGWEILVPFYNVYVMCKIAGLPKWCTVLFFIPIANLVISVLFAIKLAQKFDKRKAFGFWMLLILAPIGYSVLAFGKSTYNAELHVTKKTADRFKSNFLKKVGHPIVPFVAMQTIITLGYFFDNGQEKTTGKVLRFIEFANIHPIAWSIPLVQIVSVLIFIKWRKFHSLIVLIFVSLSLAMSVYYNDKEVRLSAIATVADFVAGIFIIYLIFYLITLICIHVVRILKLAHKKIEQ
jgi:hypothetical protein